MSHSPSHIEAHPATVVKAHSRFSDYVTLTKPRLNFLVLFTTAAAYSLGAPPTATLLDFVHTLVGTFLVAGGAGFGLTLTMLGAAELAYFVNPLSAAVALFTTVSYVLFYTPLKLRTSLSTLAGALPGALPAVIGWAAATNTLSIEAWVLFGIVFMWQMPHFLAIAWLYRDEYARAGMPLLPVIEPDGRSTGRQAVLYTAVLIPISMLPTGVGLATAWYLVGAITLGAILMLMSLEFSAKRDLPTARRLFFGSILYLPILWALLVFDHRAR